MAFRNWRIGMHIQQDSIAIVALLQRANGGESDTDLMLHR